MNKIYNIEIKLGSRWTLVHTERRHTDALHHVKTMGGVKYPIRVVRVTRTVIFEGK